MGVQNWGYSGSFSQMFSRIISSENLVNSKKKPTSNNLFKMQPQPRMFPLKFSEMFITFIFTTTEYLGMLFYWNVTKGVMRHKFVTIIIKTKQSSSFQKSKLTMFPNSYVYLKIHSTYACDIAYMWGTYCRLQS